MKKTFYFLRVYLIYILFLVIGYTPYILSVGSLFHQNGILTKQVSNIFDHLGIPVSTLSEANAFAQKNLLRIGERWDSQTETDLHKIMLKNKSLLLEDLIGLEMINTVMPVQKSFTYALIMGALKKRVLLRLDYLAELEQQGYTFQEIVLLGGERQLQDEEKKGLPATITTEAEMMRYLCENHQKLKNKKVFTVNAPMIKKNDNTLVRPTTDSTLLHFTKIAPRNGSCLVISNNPYVVRQTKVAQRVLDQSRFVTYGAGKEAEKDDMDIIMLMDEFARTLYEEHLQLNLCK